MSSVFTPHAVKWDLLQLCCLCVLAQAAEEIYTGLEGAGFACLFMPYGLFSFFSFFKLTAIKALQHPAHKVISRPKLMDASAGL